MTSDALRVSVVEGGKDPGNQVILDGLEAFNAAKLGRDAGPVALSVFVRDDTGEVQGGLIGRMKYEWLYVEKFWLPEVLRGAGLGSDVLRAAERHAIERGCRWSHLQTLEHQALPFYERRGYAVFAVLEGYPSPGGKRYYLRKTLIADGVRPFEDESSAHDPGRTIRETAETDVEALFDLRARTRENAMSRDVLARMGVTPSSTLAAMRSGDMKSWVCTQASNVVGFCSAAWKDGEVLVLAVSPEFEGTGIGSELLRHAVRWLRSRGCDRIWLAASSDPACRAYGFYRSQGWMSTGERQPNGDEILVYGREDARQ